MKGIEDADIVLDSGQGYGCENKMLQIWNILMNKIMVEVQGQLGAYGKLLFYKLEHWEDEKGVV